MQALLDQIVSTFREQLSSNQFLSGGFALMIIGGLLAACRRLPGQIWRWLVHRAFIEFEIPLNDEAFWWLNDWLAEQKYTKHWARWLSVRTRRRHSGDSDNDKPLIILSPAPGRHWMFWRGYLTIVSRVRDENHSGNTMGSIPVPRETFNVSILTWRRDTVVDLLEEARKVAEPVNDKRIKIYVPGYDDWSVEVKKQPRSTESVVMPSGMLESLIERISKFRDSEKWYAERGIPYRLGVLFYGPPGNGKSSSVFALASYFGFGICIISLGTSSLGDDDLRRLFSSIPENSFVLLEDIDCVFDQREGTADKDSKITFSGLLNAIDGVAASEGRVLFMTTNHIEKLDPALIRPGRCDIRYHVDNADTDQATRLFSRFFPEHSPLATYFGEQVGPHRLSMAALQNHLLEYAHRDPHNAISNLAELFANESKETNKVSI